MFSQLLKGELKNKTKNDCIAVGLGGTSLLAHRLAQWGSFSLPPPTLKPIDSGEKLKIDNGSGLSIGLLEFSTIFFFVPFRKSRWPS